MNNHTLTTEEIIARIEQAPAEMQAMVAKAFLREDIADEDVQYTFNTDSIEELNEEGFAVVENVDAEEPIGIGAGEFSIRNSKPGAGNKNFITTGSGGWNTCIKGYPRDKDCDVLANCVGYASGRFNEIINNIRGTSKCTYRTLNCNAENFVERAVAAGLKTGSMPKVGAIMCWQKGSLASGDGAGHVAIVEKVNSDISVYTSESGYGSNAFWNSTRSNSNGRWGIGSSYSFRCFIYLPDDVQEVIDNANKPKPTPIPTPTPTAEWPKRHTVVGGDTVSGIANTYYGKSTKPYWDLIKNANNLDNNYTIIIGNVLTIPNPAEVKEEPVVPTPVPSNKFKIGDKVKIIGTGNGSSYGTSNTAYGIGWTRQILKIWEGRAYPYQVGNNSGTTGFYKADALEKQ